MRQVLRFQVMLSLTHLDIVAKSINAVDKCRSRWRESQHKGENEDKSAFSGVSKESKSKSAIQILQTWHSILCLHLAVSLLVWGASASKYMKATQGSTKTDVLTANKFYIISPVRSLTAASMALFRYIFPTLALKSHLGWAFRSRLSEPQRCRPLMTGPGMWTC